MLFFFAFPRFVTVSTAFVLAEVGSFDEVLETKAGCTIFCHCGTNTLEVGSRRSPASKKNAPRPKSVPKHSKIKYNLFHLNSL